MLEAHRVLRNARLLTQAVVQHLLDDPALLPIQVSRRLPLRARRRIGNSLRAVLGSLPGGQGLAALGASMAGDEDRALHLLREEGVQRSRAAGEVAVLLDRADLLPADAAPAVRARGQWQLGELGEAVRTLEAAGRGERSQARQYRSELRLLGEDHRLRVRSSRSESVPSADGPLRVLHLLTNSLPHTQSGYALRTHNILTALATQGIESLALTRTGYPVMLGKPFCEDEDVIDGIRYRRTLPSRLGASPEERLEREVDEAIRLVGEFRPHVLHTTSDYRNALVAQAVSAATGLPWVYEVRGLMEQTWIASHRSATTRTAAARSEKVARIIEAEASLAREASAVVTLSCTMAEVLEGRGVPGDRISLVPNGVDETLLAETLAPALARDEIGLDLPAGAFVVGAVSALVDYEGFDVLLHAVAQLLEDPGVSQEDRDRLHVLLVGDGVAAPALEELAEALGIRERLHMPGRVPAPSARTWVQALDVVVVPRKDLQVTRTVTPQKPAEALALGRPVVVTDLPALRETVLDQAGGLVGEPVPADDPTALAGALGRLMSDEACREDLSRRGRRAAAARSWAASMRTYEHMYRSVMASGVEERVSGE